VQAIGSGAVGLFEGSLWSIANAGRKPSVAELDRLLPDNWLKEHPEHVWKINQIRREEDKKRSY
jgi:hypothetical protein